MGMRIFVQFAAISTYLSGAFAKICFLQASFFSLSNALQN
jgi:hypothetical protein